MYPMIAWWEAALMLAGGLAALSWSSDRLVEDAALIARRLGVSTFVIGVVLVGFGTSLPEFAVTVISACDGHGDLVLANICGSNSYNIAIILGLAALMRPMRPPASMRLRTVPILVIVTALCWLLVFMTGGVSRLWGAAMLLAFVLFVPFVAQTDPSLRMAMALEQDDEARLDGIAVRLCVLLSLIFLSSHFVVWGSVVGARYLGVSEATIGLTVVAIGTSLPELSTTLAAIRQDDTPLALGNIIGSNFFNTLVVVGVGALVQPLTALTPTLVYRDLPVCLAMTVLLLCRRLGTGWAIGVMLGYAAYMVAVVA